LQISQNFGETSSTSFSLERGQLFGREIGDTYCVVSTCDMKKADQFSGVIAALNERGAGVQLLQLSRAKRDLCHVEIRFPLYLT